MSDGTEFSVDPADNGMIHTTIRTQQNGEMIHNATQNSMQFYTDELFLEYFHLVFGTSVGYIEWKP